MGINLENLEKELVIPLDKMFQWFSKSFEQSISIAPPMYLWQLKLGGHLVSVWVCAQVFCLLIPCIFLGEFLSWFRFLHLTGLPATIETPFFHYMFSFIAQLTRNMIFLTRMLIRGKELNWFVNINLIVGSVYSLSLIPSTSRSDGTATPHDGSRMGLRLTKAIGPQPSPSLDQYTMDTSQVHSRQDLIKDTFPPWILEILSLYLVCCNYFTGSLEACSKTGKVMLPLPQSPDTSASVLPTQSRFL